MSRSKIQAWRNIAATQTVLDWIEHSIKIPFKQVPKPAELKNFVRSDAQEKIVDEELQELVTSGAIRRCQEKPECILPISCAPKKNGKFRLVLDYRYVNKHIDVPRFSQEGFKPYPNLLNRMMTS